MADEGSGTQGIAAQVSASASSSGLSWNGSGFSAAPSTGGGSSGGGGGSSAPGPKPAGTPANATWNGTNWQWGGSGSGSGSALGQAGYAGSVPAQALGNAALTPINSSNGSPVATGFDLAYQMLDATMRAEQLRQNAIDQVVNVAQLVAQLNRSSPTEAADLAVALGLPQLQPDFGFTKRLSNKDTTATFGGTVGDQAVQLPFSFNGKELNFFNSNRNAASVISDIAGRFGRPDLLSTSALNVTPTSASLFKL